MPFHENNNNRHESDTTEIMEKVDIDALAERCLKLLEKSNEGDHDASSCRSFNCYKQVFVGIAGGPGSGKSFIAEEICKAINKKNPNGDPDEEECIVIPMDGYHLTRQEMKEMANRGNNKVYSDESSDDSDETTEIVMTYDQLLARRGAPFTFAPSRFIADLRKCKENGEGSFPVYDRELHDPIPNAVHMTQGNKIILVEGLYLLCLDDDDWKPLDELWDGKWYVDVSEEETKRRLVERHLKTWDEQKTKEWGGSDRAAAMRKAEKNDLKNARCIASHSKHHATLIIKNETIPKDKDDYHPTFPRPCDEYRRP